MSSLGLREAIFYVGCHISKRGAGSENIFKILFFCIYGIGLASYILDGKKFWEHFLEQSIF